MRRRGFLTMLGAAVATPFLPGGAVAGASRNTFAVAAAHARKFPFISVIGIKNRVGVPQAEAERLLVELSRRGLVGPVNACATGPISASSRVFRPEEEVLRAVKARQASRKAAQVRRAAQRAESQIRTAELPGWLRHLHQMCRAQGMALHPRATGAMA